eukprot:CAMPEP_0174873026 /NCGR_PEP_ID=MMETSP1114-20130205/74233_1 /TAXON_ID=312471 /ORGANISM="Neobodo designis, Strain CCAP 1951/1" /LENGTH=119 /DNA_ID=CAMNT_0016108337 /DNA_START=317 /DNA_END=673 /DNA_ORIENTATION=+
MVAVSLQLILVAVWPCGVRGARSAVGGGVDMHPANASSKHWASALRLLRPRQPVEIPRNRAHDSCESVQDLLRKSCEICGGSLVDRRLLQIAVLIGVEMLHTRLFRDTCERCPRSLRDA